MDRRTREILTEILKKENERYKLDQIGFIRNLPTEIDSMSNYVIISPDTLENIESYQQWRFSLLQRYYSEKQFSAFLHIHLNDPIFQKMVFELLQSILEQRFHHEPRTEADRYLAPTGKTLSYLLCQEHPALYATYFTPSLNLSSTQELNKYCTQITRDIFPLSTADILLLLKQENKACWENICARLKTLTETVTKTLIKSYRNDAIHDMWTETCFELKKAIQNEKLQENADASGVLAYAAGIVRNKIREFFRKQKKEPYLFIENWERDLSLKDSQFYCNEFKEEPAMKDFLDLNDIDAENDYEYRIALSCVLYDPNHPKHKQLIEGMEDKVEILLTHYTKNLSYEEIAVEKYGQMTEKELKKKADKLRQDVSRVKIKIKERFKQILKENKM